MVKMGRETKPPPNPTHDPNAPARAPVAKPFNGKFEPGTSALLPALNLRARVRVRGSGGGVTLLVAVPLLWQRRALAQCGATWRKCLGGDALLNVSENRGNIAPAACLLRWYV